MKLSGQRVLRNRQQVSVTGLRNRQSVSVTGLRNRQSVSVTQISSSLALLRRLDCLFLKPVTETDCLFLKPVTETHCLFFSTLWPDNFIKISWFRGEGGQKRNFYLEYSVQEGYLYHILKILSMWYGPFKTPLFLQYILVSPAITGVIIIVTLPYRCYQTILYNIPQSISSQP